MADYKADSINTIPSVVAEELAYTATSKKNAIGMKVLNDSKGLAPEIGSVRMNRFTEPKVEDLHRLDPKPSDLSAKLSEMYKPKTDTKDFQKPYDYLDYQHSSIESGQQFAPPMHDFQDISDLVAYDRAVRKDLGAFEKQKSKVKEYFVADDKYSITAAQGYIPELGLNYLVLNLFKDDELEQQHTVIVKDEEESLLEDERVMEELGELLTKIKDKDDINEKDVLESIKKLKIGKSDEEIKVINNILKQINKKKKLKNLRILLDKDRELALEVFRNYKPKKYGISYYFNNEYIKQLERKKNDFTNLVPHKTVSKSPISIMGGVLGYTYLGENFMVIRDDLNGYEANEVEIHEAIHTPDEYETRVITKWMLEDDTKYH